MQVSIMRSTPGTVSRGELGSIHGVLHEVLSSWWDIALSPYSAHVLLTGALVDRHPASNFDHTRMRQLQDSRWQVFFEPGSAFDTC